MALNRKNAVSTFAKGVESTLLGRFGLCSDSRNTVSSACYQILNDFEEQTKNKNEEVFNHMLKYVTDYYMVMAFITIILLRCS